jgi:hypothetical protein
VRLRLVHTARAGTKSLPPLEEYNTFDEWIPKPWRNGKDRFALSAVALARADVNATATLEVEGQPAAHAALILGKHQHRSVVQHIWPVSLRKQIAKIDQRLKTT